MILCIQLIVFHFRKGRIRGREFWGRTRMKEEGWRNWRQKVFSVLRLDIVPAAFPKASSPPVKKSPLQ